MIIWRLLYTIDAGRHGIAETTVVAQPGFRYLTPLVQPERIAAHYRRLPEAIRSDEFKR